MTFARTTAIASLTVESISTMHAGVRLRHLEFIGCASGLGDYNLFFFLLLDEYDVNGDDDDDDDDDDQATL